MQKQKLKSNQNRLLLDPIDKLLTQLTIPLIFGMVAVLTFNLVDTFFISLLGTNSLAAISFTFPVIFAINSMTMGIGVGVSAHLGRILGKKLEIKAKRFASHGLLLIAVLSTLLSIIGYFTIDPLFALLGANQELRLLIEQYMATCYLFIPLLAISMVGNNILRATGDTKTPAVILIISGVINSILDPLFIFGLGPIPAMGVQGAAIASGISWTIAVGWSFYILIHKTQLLGLWCMTEIIDDWKKILHIGTPAAFSNALLPISGAILMALLASQGTESVAAYGAAQRIESFLLIIVICMTSALTPIMSQNLGAKQDQRAFLALFTGIRYSLLIQFLIFIAMVPLSSPFSALFSQDIEVQKQIWLYLIVVPLSYGCQGIVMMLVSSLNALHQPKQALGWNLFRLFGLLLPFAWIGKQLNGTEGLFIGIMVANFISGFAAYFFAKKIRAHHLG
ncbi:MATE family efflux transporter [Vibrio sp. SS-MA-C1-2]|uniref:MATE family efflux transporter n=1 Tax=Vibrio sp. SS-MA-C1-2 TaxID=2908646 RepID=UPI001F38B0E7|nr:MATE family efflux transporter [Vibrio sp. SS-MA-C1-2]UJF19500.1 MATE family efflux transporter [Vibrio sp. SS-MA-C1-2]